jgi:hypothetical protein
MKKILFPVVALFVLASCVDNNVSNFQSYNSLGESFITESFITENIITETTISETVISETIIEEETSSEEAAMDPLKKAYLQSWEQNESAAYQEYETNPLVPLVDLMVSAPNTVQVGQGTMYYDMLNFVDEHMTFVALISSFANEGQTIENGWTVARMGYGLSKSYHYDFMRSINADWFNGTYTYWENPSQVNAFYGGITTWTKGLSTLYVTLAFMDNGTVRFLPLGAWSIVVS